MVLRDVWAFYLKSVVKCWKRGKISTFSSFSWIMSFSPTFEKLSSFLYGRWIPTTLEYPWFVLVLIYSSQIFRWATHQSRREIWCPPLEQGPHRGPCIASGLVWSGLFSKSVHTQKGYKVNWVQRRKKSCPSRQFLIKNASGMVWSGLVKKDITTQKGTG